MHVETVIKVILRANLSVKNPKIGEKIKGIIKIRFDIVFDSFLEIEYLCDKKSFEKSLKL